MIEHESFILRTFDLAKQGEGYVSPNPLVGAIIVKDGKIIAEGYHHKFGDKHAEVEAIYNAGNIDFSDCTLYCNLEPCDNYGKTPPCTDLIIEKKFKRVVIANIDPNPYESGRGVQKLKDNGIEVITNILQKEGAFLNRVFFKNQTSNKPYIVAKVAQSLDGCVATKDGISKWISNETSRRYTHLLRSHLDAIMVGRNTILKDNPLLNTRLVDGRNPIKIALDTNLSLPLDLSIFKNVDRTHTIVVCSKNSSTSRKAEILKLGGIKILSCETIDEISDKLRLEDAFQKIYNEYHITSILIEGGPMVHSYLLENNLIDELHVFIAPKIIGDGLKSFGAVNTPKIELSNQFNLYAVNNLDGDIHSLYLNNNL